MRILIVSMGSIGRRHLSNLRAIDPSVQVTVWHLHRRSNEMDISGGVDDVVFSLAGAMDTKPDAALVTCPASQHVATSLALARMDVHLFIEKPLSTSLEGVDDLLEVCAKRRLVLMIGYNLRFSPSLKILRKALIDGRIGRPLSIRAEVGQYLPDWRPGTDYRCGVSAQRVLGGGVVWELSHELDYVRWLLGEVRSVHAVTGRLSDLEINVEDLAEIVLEFVNGAVGSIHLNMVQRAPSRSCRAIGTEGVLVWDGITQEVRLYSAKEQTWTVLYTATVVDRNEMYLAELQHFLECVRSGKEAEVGGNEGKRVVEIALAVFQSSQERRSVAV